MKGIKLVGIVMVVMILVGTMMVPAHADYKETTTFEERFEILFDLYLKNMGLEEYFEINEDEGWVDGDMHYFCVDFTDTAIDEIKDSYVIDSDNIFAFADIVVNEVTYEYCITAVLYVDGEEYDRDVVTGDDMLDDFLF